MYNAAPSMAVSERNSLDRFMRESVHGNFKPNFNADDDNVSRTGGSNVADN
jgi:hypothetical protein